MNILLIMEIKNKIFICLAQKNEFPDSEPRRGTKTENQEVGKIGSKDREPKLGTKTGKQDGEPRRGMKIGNQVSETRRRS